MISFQEISTLKKTLRAEKSNGKKIGFVPTMGALHEGHLQLIKKAVDENNVCVCSIFVNPTQFNNEEDLKKYPRNLDADLKKLESAGCKVVFVPEVSEMYPEPNHEKFDLGHLNDILEGEFRPGHFNGVAVVVKKLLKIIEPDGAYFGEKDFQQLAVINRLVEIENLPVQIIPCATVREVDGLAMSSRNMRLTEKERKLAPIIYQTLSSIKKSFDGKNADELRTKAITNLNAQEGMKVEYLEIVDEKTLMPYQMNKLGDNKSIALIATFLGKVRLIDNIRLS